MTTVRQILEPLSTGRRSLWMLAVLAVLGIGAYLRAASLPFIADDYYQISLAWRYGPVSNWSDLLLDPLYRCRATSIVLTWLTWRVFDLNPLAYNWSSILLHVANTWLVFALGMWRFVGWRTAFLAAAFFAVYEGHQEAVIWYAALPELLVFFFILLTFLSWIAWLQSGRPRYYWCALAAFLLALASKESAVAAVPLLFIAWMIERRAWRRGLLFLAPFAAPAAVYAFLIHASRSEHLFYHDGTFSLSAPFVLTLAVSTGRLFWFWGLAGFVALAAFRPCGWWKTLGFAAAWIWITFLPYAFLTYMPRVPSRHTYLASAGLSLVVAAGLLALQSRSRQARAWALPALAVVIVVHNCGYLWTRKHAQFVERAAPTETLVQLARTVSGPIHLHCFPYGPDIARAAIEVVDRGKPRQLTFGGSPPRDAASLCFRLHPPQLAAAASTRF